MLSLHLRIRKEGMPTTHLFNRSDQDNNQEKNRNQKDQKGGKCVIKCR